MPDRTGFPLASDIDYPTAAQEYRRPFYYDRGSVMTQGGNLDYGLRQYVSAVEFKAGPTANPHLPRIQSKNGKIRLIRLNAGTTFSTDNGTTGVVPTGHLPTNYKLAAVNEATGRKYQITFPTGPSPRQVSMTFTAHPLLDSTAPSLSAGFALW